MVPVAKLEPWNAIAGRGSMPGCAKSPGLSGAIGSPMASLTVIEPSALVVRTNKLLLLVSTNSNGTCAVIWVGETNNSGNRSPSIYTSTPPRSTGRF